MLSNVYIYPKKGIEIQAEITKRMNLGLYDSINTKEEFRATITDELREVSKDSHLSLMLVKDENAKLTHVRTELVEERKNNFAFQKLEVLPRNVGYMKINKFYSDERARLVVDHAFGYLESSDAMIIDLRDCVGGSPELVRYVVSHFFHDEKKLWSIHGRGDESITDYLSIKGLGSEHLKSGYPLIILIGPQTASAAELFSYTLKNFKKAIIIGENSKGAAHLVGAQRINQYFNGRFSIARPVNPVTNDSWEGVGVTPNIFVSSGNSGLVAALDAAHKALDAPMSK